MFDISTMSSTEIGENIQNVLERENRPISLSEMSGVLGIDERTLKKVAKHINNVALTKHLGVPLFVITNEEVENNGN